MSSKCFDTVNCLLHVYYSLVMNCTVFRCHTCVKTFSRPLISRWKLHETKNVERTICCVTTTEMVTLTGNNWTTMNDFYYRFVKLRWINILCIIMYCIWFWIWILEICRSVLSYYFYGKVVKIEWKLNTYWIFYWGTSRVVTVIWSFSQFSASSPASWKNCLSFVSFSDFSTFGYCYSVFFH